MAVTPYLNPSLTRLRGEINRAFPLRDKASDGWIGDAAHAVTDSDHNPDKPGTAHPGSVDALDVDAQLNGRGKPYRSDVKRVLAAFQRHEAAKYWIFESKIASRTWGWEARPYYGANPHDKHFHLNTRESHETSTKPWGITGGETVAGPVEANLTAAAIDKLLAEPYAAGHAETLPNGKVVTPNNLPIGRRMAWADWWSWVGQLLGRSIYERQSAHGVVLENLLVGQTVQLNATEALPDRIATAIADSLMRNPAVLNAIGEAIGQRIPTLPSPRAYAQAVVAEWRQELPGLLETLADGIRGE